MESVSHIDGSGIVGSFNQSHLASKLAQSEKSRGQNAVESGAREARRRFELAREEILQTETLHGRRVEPDEEHPDPRGGPQRKRPKPLAQLLAEKDQEQQEQAGLTEGPPAGDEDDRQRGQLIDIRA